MSKTIDERVVEMRFDNKQFEQNVQTSISSIEKLEKSLKIEKVPPKDWMTLMPQQKIAI